MVDYPYFCHRMSFSFIIKYMKRKTNQTFAEKSLEIPRKLPTIWPVISAMHTIENSVRPRFFICWITSHFQEFQSAVIGKKIKIELEPKIKKLM